jgi:hypothetical protein
MHLTNYEEDDNLDTHDAKKRSLKSLFGDLKKQNQDVEKLWKEIQVKINIFKNSKSRFIFRISL